MHYNDKNIHTLEKLQSVDVLIVIAISNLNLRCKIIILITIKTSTLCKMVKCGCSYRYNDKNTDFQVQCSYQYNDKNIHTLIHQKCWRSYAYFIAVFLSV